MAKRKNKQIQEARKGVIKIWHFVLGIVMAFSLWIVFKIMNGKIGDWVTTNQGWLIYVALIVIVLGIWIGIVSPKKIWKKIKGIFD